MAWSIRELGCAIMLDVFTILVDILISSSKKYRTFGDSHCRQQDKEKIIFLEILIIKTKKENES